MRKQAIVVGLGQFGMALARSLADKDVEVLAIDRREELVRSAAAFADEAIAVDATDERELARTSPERRDLCIVAIGDEARESSIIATALFRQMGAPLIVGRATDPLHGRILRLVGAHEVVNPERAFGERLAARLLYTGVIDEIPLGKDLSITELEVPAAFVGKNLKTLQLPRRYGVTVIALRRSGMDDVLVPSADEPLRKGDIMVVVARRDAVAKLVERV